MDVLKINKNTPVYGFKSMDVRYLFEESDRLLVVFNNVESHKLYVGDRLSFVRDVVTDNGFVEHIVGSVGVLEIGKYDDDGVEYDSVYTSKPNVRQLRYKDGMSFEYTYWDWDEERGEYVKLDVPPANTYDYVFATDNSLSGLSEEHVYTSASTRAAIEKISYIIPWEFETQHLIDEGVSGETDFFASACSIDMDFRYDELVEYYKLTFSTDHNIFQQDIDLVNGNILLDDYTIVARDADGNIIGRLMGVRIPREGGVIGVSKPDTYDTEYDETCGIYDEYGKPYDIRVHNYTYCPGIFSRNSILFLSASTEMVQSSVTDTSVTYARRATKYVLDNAVYFEPIYNEFYFKYFNDVNKCICNRWVDIWWSEFERISHEDPLRDVFYGGKYDLVDLTHSEMYFSLSIPVDSDTDSQSLGGSDESQTSYVDRVIESYIPEVIDMERVQYRPEVINDTDYVDATGISMYFHFRKRKHKTDDGSELPYEYEDGWYIDPDMENLTWFNNMDYDDSKISSDAMKDFVEEYGHSSDLLGYLGFTDNDVYFQKSKIKNSFIRLSFYTSNDTLTQKLLYYSTIFLDSGSLYGKYLKQSNYIEELDSERGKESKIPVVFREDGFRLDTEINLVDEFSSEGSSEGFNVYLFADDVSLSDRTIYMKVEFNHAGCGKTIPMILWPKDGEGNYLPLERKSFLENLYIPVTIRYIDGKYRYSIPGAENEGTDIKLVLFEPKLEIEVIESEEE